MSEFEIKLGLGLNNISFGHKQRDVINIIGEPDKKDEYVYPDNTISKELHYYNLDLSFYFNSDDDFKLSLISIYSSKFNINSEIRINKTSIENLLKYSKEMGFGEYEIEDCSTIEDPTHQLISFDKINTNFWFDYKILSSIQISPFWLDDENYKWPLKIKK